MTEDGLKKIETTFKNDTFGSLLIKWQSNFRVISLPFLVIKNILMMVN